MKVAITLLAVVAVTFGTPWDGESRGDQWWQDMHNSFVRNSNENPGGIRVLFYGDSITQWWANEGRDVFNQYYAPLGTANYGIAADRTEHLVWRIQNGEVNDRMNPAVCVLKIGTNNLGDTNNNAPDIARGVETIINELRWRLPNMKILLVGILPRTNEEWTRRTSEVNALISRFDDGRMVRFLDLKDHFYRGGNEFVWEYYTDLLHLTAAGYRKWAEVMDPLFREMLNS